MNAYLDHIYPAARADEDGALPHEQLHGVLHFFAGLHKAGYQSHAHCRAGHSKHKVPLIMKSIQIALLAQALGPGNPGAHACAGPTPQAVSGFPS